MTEVQCSKRLIESLKEAALNTEGGVYRFVGMEIQNSVVWKKSESVSHPVVSNSLWPHGLYPARLFCPWDSAGKNTGLVAMPFSTAYSWPRDRIRVSCIAGRFFTVWVTR